MKSIKIIFFAAVAMLFMACQQKPSTDVQQAKVPAADAPVITFEKEIYEFGTIKEGDKVQHDFKFTNTGKSPLIITDATATCGCTVPEPPKDPIKPGAQGVIKVIFNSTGKMGLIDKIITVTSNANPVQSTVHMVGEVKAK